MNLSTGPVEPQPEYRSEPVIVKNPQIENFQQKKHPLITDIQQMKPEPALKYFLNATLSFLSIIINVFDQQYNDKRLENNKN